MLLFHHRALTVKYALNSGVVIIITSCSEIGVVMIQNSLKTSVSLFKSISRLCNQNSLSPKFKVHFKHVACAIFM